MIESELKSATVDMKDKFLSALAKDGTINEPAISFESLGQTFGPLQKQVAESIEKQASLVERIKVRFIIFSHCCGYICFCFFFGFRKRILSL